MKRTENAALAADLTRQIAESRKRGDTPESLAVANLKAALSEREGATALDAVCQGAIVRAVAGLLSQLRVRQIADVDEAGALVAAVAKREARQGAVDLQALLAQDDPEDADEPDEDEVVDFSDQWLYVPEFRDEVQAAVEDVFGDDEAKNGVGREIQELVRDVYAQTQAQLEEMGDFQPTLYRALVAPECWDEVSQAADVDDESGKVLLRQVHLGMEPASSWTASYDVAKSVCDEHADQPRLLLSMPIHREAILGIPSTGLGASDYDEVVVLFGSAYAADVLVLYEDEPCPEADVLDRPEATGAVAESANVFEFDRSEAAKLSWVKRHANGEVSHKKPATAVDPKRQHAAHLAWAKRKGLAPPAGPALQSAIAVGQQDPGHVEPQLPTAQPSDKPHHAVNPEFATGENEKLAMAAKTGDQKARDKLVYDNQGMIRKLARKWTKDPNDLDDFISEGNHALLHNAIDGYDPSRGAFAQYAYHVVRGKLHKFGKKWQAERASGATARDGEDRHQHEEVADDPSPHQAAQKHEAAAALKDALSDMDPRHAEIVRRHMGLHDKGAETLSDIAQDLGITRGSASQMFKTTLARLKDKLSKSTMDYAAESLVRDYANYLAEIAKKSNGTVLEDEAPSGGKWITIGGHKGQNGDHEGGFPIEIDGQGRILKSGGTKGLVGKHISKVGTYFGRLHNTPAAHKRRAEAKVRKQAKGWGMDPKDYDQIADSLWKERADQINSREEARAEASRRIGVHAGDIQRLENQHKDYGSGAVKGLDTLGRELAGRYPQLGWGQGYGDQSGHADNVDHAALLWDLLKEGKQAVPTKGSDAYHAAVDEYLQYLADSSGTPAPAAPAKKSKAKPVDDSFDFGENAKPKPDDFDPPGQGPPPKQPDPPPKPAPQPSAAQQPPAAPPQPAAPAPQGTKAIQEHVAHWTPEQKMSDWKANGVKGASFKSFFGDWEHDKANASRVINPQTGEPQETHGISGEGSKVKDANGNPIVVYHGTARGGFDAFDASKVGENNLFGKGFYFTQDKVVADQYQEKGAHKLTFDDFKSAYDTATKHEPPENVIGGFWASKLASGEKTLQDVFVATSQPGTLNPAVSRAMKHGWEMPFHEETKSVYLNIRKPFDIDKGEIKLGEMPEQLRAKFATPELTKAFPKEQLDNLGISHDTLFSAAGGHDELNELLRGMGYDGLTHIGGDRMGGGHHHRVWIAFAPSQVKATDNRGTFDPRSAKLAESQAVVLEAGTSEGAKKGWEHRHGIAASNSLPESDRKWTDEKGGLKPGHPKRVNLQWQIGYLQSQIDEAKGQADKHQQVSDDWEGRKYKDNRSSIAKKDIYGDEIGKQQIGDVNERRRAGVVYGGRHAARENRELAAKLESELANRKHELEMLPAEKPSGKSEEESLAEIMQQMSQGPEHEEMLKLLLGDSPKRKKASESASTLAESFDEAKVVRNADGEFAPKGSGAGHAQSLAHQAHPHRSRVVDHVSHATRLRHEVPMPEEVTKITQALKLSGDDKLYAVGGAVRDYLDHKWHDPEGKYEPKDVDLATNLDSQDLMDRLSSPAAKDMGVTVKNPAGANTFGVVFAYVNGQQFEIAPFRRDVGGDDGRHPDHVERGDFLEDAGRRDLTYNNLYYDIAGKEIIDPNHGGQGLSDLRSKHTRVVGNPADRFGEDRLRVMRLVRFFSRMNPGSVSQDLDEDTKAAVQRFRDMSGVSDERIVNEFSKGLEKAKHPGQYVRNFAEVGLTERMFPGLKVNVDGMEPLTSPQDLPVVLAAALRDNADIHGPLTKLRYPKDVTTRAQYLLDVMRADHETAPALAKKLDDSARSQMRELAKVVAGEPAQRLRHMADYKLPSIDAEDLARQGFKGAALGKELAQRQKADYAQSFAKRPVQESWAVESDYQPEHKGKGPGGGQFVGHGEVASNPQETPRHPGVPEKVASQPAFQAMSDQLKDLYVKGELYKPMSKGGRVVFHGTKSPTQADAIVAEGYKVGGQVHSPDLGRMGQGSVSLTLDNGVAGQYAGRDGAVVSTYIPPDLKIIGEQEYESKAGTGKVTREALERLGYDAVRYDSTQGVEIQVFAPEKLHGYSFRQLPMRGEVVDGKFVAYEIFDNCADSRTNILEDNRTPEERSAAAKKAWDKRGRKLATSQPGKVDTVKPEEPPAELPKQDPPEPPAKVESVPEPEKPPIKEPEPPSAEPERPVESKPEEPAKPQEPKVEPAADAPKAAEAPKKAVSFKIPGKGEWEWDGNDPEITGKGSFATPHYSVKRLSDGAVGKLSDYGGAGWRIQMANDSQWKYAAHGSGKNLIKAKLLSNQKKETRAAEGSHEAGAEGRKKVTEIFQKSLEEIKLPKGYSKYELPESIRLSIDETKRVAAESFHRVIDKFGAKALQHIGELEAITLYADQMTLAENVKDGSGVMGVYRHDAKTGSLELTGSGISDPDGTFAHEMTHAVDGPVYTYSSTRKWANAWEAEIGSEDKQHIRSIKTKDGELKRLIGKAATEVKAGDKVYVGDGEFVELERAEVTKDSRMGKCLVVKVVGQDDQRYWRLDRPYITEDSPDAPKAPLTNYAQIKPSEGFAEFGRLLVKDPDRAARDFPKCTKLWREWNLLE